MLENRQLLSASFTTTAWTGSDAFEARFTAAFISEGRIGNTVTGGGTHELDLGQSTASPATTRDYPWGQGSAIPFTVTYAPTGVGTGTVTFDNNGASLTYNASWADGTNDSIFIRARSAKSGSVMNVRDLEIQTSELGGFVPVDSPAGTGDPDGVGATFAQGKNSLQIFGIDLQQGFTLKGTSRWTWTTAPSQSQLAFQVKVGDFLQPKVVFLDDDRNETETLKVAKWQDAFNADGSVKPNFIDLDPDHYHVRVTDDARKGAGTVTIQLWTDSSHFAGTGAEYSDGKDVLTLTETAQGTGVFESKTLMLMSDDVDDDHVVDGVEDNDPEDRTSIIALGGDVNADYEFIPDHTASATAKVPVVKRLKLHVNILKDQPGPAGQPVVPDVAGDLRAINERFAQMGIKVEATVDAPVDPPAGVDLSDGLTEYPDLVGGAIPMTDEEKALLGTAALRTVADDDVEVYFVNALSNRSYGEAFWAAGVPDAKYKNSVVIQSTREAFWILAHEVGHVLLNSGDHFNGANVNQNLMKGKVGVGNTVGGLTRVTEAQATDFLASSLLINP